MREPCGGSLISGAGSMWFIMSSATSLKLGTKWLGWLACAITFSPIAAMAADKAAIAAAMQRGVSFLAKELPKMDDTGERSLAALALFKCGFDPATAPVSTVVGEVLNKIDNGKYSSSHHHVYEAGVDINLLADIDAERYRPQIQAIAQYIMSQQLPNGGWDYPSGRQGLGDTSVVQYACLGLWAATRAGIDVPVSVWDNTLRWHAATQRTDGGFAYVPGSEEGYAKGESNLNMTSAGIANVMIAARHAFPGSADDLAELMRNPDDPDEPVIDEANLLGGVLERVDITAPPEEETGTVAGPSESTMTIGQVRDPLRRALGWISPRFVPMRPQGEHYRTYYFYTIERMGSLLNITQIGSYQWYEDCANVLLDAQEQDGRWFIDAQYGKPGRDTSFVLLFLAKSTGKILKRSDPEPTQGGGLLTGGKGEPGEVVQARKEPTPLDELLKTLQNPGSLNLEEVQTEMVREIQIGDRSELIGQKDLIVELVKHPHGEVRRTAIWALGRTNDLSLARHLVAALEDEDVGVMMEAHAALSWLSRRFDGMGLPVNPLDEVPDGASDEEKLSIIEGWRDRARREWGTWYLKVRPYKDRGDEFEAQLRQRMGG
jgi:hypothetical protein